MKNNEYCANTNVIVCKVSLSSMEMKISLKKIQEALQLPLPLILLINREQRFTEFVILSDFERIYLGLPL